MSISRGTFNALISSICSVVSGISKILRGTYSLRGPSEPHSIYSGGA